MLRKTLLVAGAGAALIALSACGPDNIAGSATSQGSGGAAAASSGPSSSAPSGDSQKISTVADLGALVQHNASAKNSVHVQMDMSIPGAGAISAQGDMKFAGTQSAEQMTMTVPGAGAMQMVIVGGNFYMKLPAALSSSDKPWVKVDTSGNDALSQSLGSTASLADQTDPTQLIDKIKSAGTITNTTHEQLNGEATTHYSINVDVKKMAANMASTDTEKQALSQLGATTMPFDIWVNSDNLPVKIVTKIAFPDPTSGKSEQVSMTALYTNWGQPVTVTAPPADQVGTLGGK
jgi:hypothetical protein